MGDNRSMGFFKMIYAAVMGQLASQGPQKSNDYSDNKFQLGSFDHAPDKKRTSRAKRKFHRQLKRR